MNITAIFPEAIHEIEYQSAAHGDVVTRRLPVLRGSVDVLPAELDALVLASDLQGRVPGPGGRLLGISVAEELVVLADLGEIPCADRIGVILAGDLYTVEDLSRRGGDGDVRGVWQAFESKFRWVGGVAGNHDRFGDTAEELAAFSKQAGVHYLDGDVVKFDGLKVGGVGGIVGKRRKNFRRPPEVYRESLRRVAEVGPDILVLHGGPDIPGIEPGGDPLVREWLDAYASPRTLVVCGHRHWDDPLLRLPGGAAVCNVDTRVIVLQRQ